MPQHAYVALLYRRFSLIVSLVVDYGWWCLCAYVLGGWVGGLIGWLACGWLTSDQQYRGGEGVSGPRAELPSGAGETPRAGMSVSLFECL